MKLPEALISEVRTGRCVLVLGAGATVGATTPDGKPPLLGNGLRDALARKFLGGDFGEEPLSWVAELAASATDLSTVQDYVAEMVVNLRPAEFHSLLPTFRWRGLATTNFDRLIETIYFNHQSPIQEVVPFISNDDRVDERLRAPNNLALLKLHGCVTRTHDPRLPLILSTDQYVTFRESRERVFGILRDMAYENTVVFVGQSLRDSNLRALLLELSKQGQSRPRYYLVKPSAAPQEEEFWGGKRISLLIGSFEDFLLSLDHAIPPNTRTLQTVMESDHPIGRRYIVSEPVSEYLRDFLRHDTTYIHEGLPLDEGTPELFYKGFDLGWYGIQHDLDTRRSLTDLLLNDVILRPETARPSPTELYVIKAEAGAGKTTFLKRLAWETAIEADFVSLFATVHGNPTIDQLTELHRVTGQRIFLFIDSAAANVSVISEIVDAGRRFALPITVITAERNNEWNMNCDALNSLLSEEFPLRYLSETEIRNLVTLLGEHGALGPNLRGKAFDEQVKEFVERAGRQLLVALHEATSGRPFEEILVDEYNNIQPLQAKHIYLTVCVLNRLGVPVRAGLVARVHDVPFSLFKDRFLAPLEHVIQVRTDKPSGDFMYTARHREIAQIVFERILRSKEDRLHEYIRVIKELNIIYSSDRTAFRGLLNARSLNALFPDYQDVMRIFSAAEEIARTEAFLYQQHANYERIRVNGNLRRARDLLRRASELDPRDNSILHTLAEVYRTEALEEGNPLKRQHLRGEARLALRNLLGRDISSSYARHTSIKLGLDELGDLLKDPDSSDRAIDDAIRSVEEQLQRSTQEHPSDRLFLTAEADLRFLLKDHERSLAALRRAFDANPHDPYIAVRLSTMYRDQGELEESRAIVNSALSSNRGDVRLNFQYASILRELGETDLDLLMYHYKRAFVPGDRNYEAQFWYARYAFESENQEQQQEAHAIFKTLRNSRLPNEARYEIRDVMRDHERETVFTGTIHRLEASYGFIDSDGSGRSVFFHRRNFSETDWSKLRRNNRFAFTVGFTLSGAVALKLEPI